MSAMKYSKLVPKYDNAIPMIKIDLISAGFLSMIFITRAMFGVIVLKEDIDILLASIWLGMAIMSAASFYSLILFVVCKRNHKRHLHMIQNGTKECGIVRDIKAHYHWRASVYYTLIIEYYVSGEKRFWKSPKYDEDPRDYFKIRDKCDIYILNDQICLSEQVVRKSYRKKKKK